MFVHRKQGLFLSVYVVAIKMVGEKQNMGSNGEDFFFLKKMVIDEPASFLDHVHLGRTQRECKPNETIIWTAHEDVWVTYFSWSNRKITVMAENSRTNSSVVLRHGGTRSKMCWTIPWIGKEDSGATSLSFASLFGLSAIQTGGNWISWSCQKFARKLTDMLSWHELDVVTCFGQCTSVQDQSQTIGKVDFLHSSHEWQTPVVPRGEHSTACRLGLFQDSDFDGDFEDSESTSRGVLCIFGSRTFCPS